MTRCECPQERSKPRAEANRVEAVPVDCHLPQSARGAARVGVEADPRLVHRVLGNLLKVPAEYTTVTMDQWPHPWSPRSSTRALQPSNLWGSVLAHQLGGALPMAPPSPDPSSPGHLSNYQSSSWHKRPSEREHAADQVVDGPSRDPPCTAVTPPCKLVKIDDI